MALEVVVDSKEMLPREDIDRRTAHVFASIWAFIIAWMPMFSKANDKRTPRVPITSCQELEEERIPTNPEDIRRFLEELNGRRLEELSRKYGEEGIRRYRDPCEDMRFRFRMWELFPLMWGFFPEFRELGTRVKSISPSTSLGGWQSSSSTALSRKHARRDLEASTSGNQPLPHDHGHPVGDDTDPGITPSLPRSNSALAIQTDLEAAINSPTSGNQPPPHDHGHAEGTEQPPPGEGDPVEDGCANKVEIGFMIISELLSVLDAIRKKDEAPEMSHYTKGLYYTLVGCSVIGFACYWNAFFIYRLKRSCLVSKLLIGTAHAATCFAVLAIISLEFHDKFSVGFYVAACAFCIPGAIYSAIK